MPLAKGIERRLPGQWFLLFEQHMGSDHTKHGCIIVELEAQNLFAGFVTQNVKADVRMSIAARKERNPSTLCSFVIHFEVRVRTRQVRGERNLRVIAISPQHVEDKQHVVDASGAGTEIENLYTIEVRSCPAVEPFGIGHKGQPAFVLKGWQELGGFGV